MCDFVKILPKRTVCWKGLIGSHMYKLITFVTYYLWLVSFFLSKMTVSVLHIGQGGEQAGKARSFSLAIRSCLMHEVPMDK